MHKVYLFDLAHWSTEQHTDRLTDRTTISPPSPCVGGPWRGAKLGQPDSGGGGRLPLGILHQKKGAQQVKEAERPPPKGTKSGKQPGGNGLGGANNMGGRSESKEYTIPPVKSAKEVKWARGCVKVGKSSINSFVCCVFLSRDKKNRSKQTVSRPSTSMNPIQVNRKANGPKDGRPQRHEGGACRTITAKPIAIQMSQLAG